MNLEEVRAREAAHFLPVFGRMPVALVEGRGSILRDVAGREFVDLTAGWGVTCIGHCHPALVEAISSQAGRLMQTTNLFYTVPQLDLIEKLAALTPDEITRSILVNSGTEATDGALKLAHRATGRAKFVSTEGSFHGRTLGALGVIGQAKHREPYAALLPEPIVVPYGDCDAADAAIDEETAAVIVEPIQGEGGVRVPPPGYLREVREICQGARSAPDSRRGSDRNRPHRQDVGAGTRGRDPGCAGPRQRPRWRLSDRCLSHDRGGREDRLHRRSRRNLHRQSPGMRGSQRRPPGGLPGEAPGEGCGAR